MHKVKKESSFVGKKLSQKKLNIQKHIIMPFKVEFDERILSESAIKENLLECDNDLSVDYNSKRKSTNYDKKFVKCTKRKTVADDIIGGW